MYQCYKYLFIVADEHVPLNISEYIGENWKPDEVYIWYVEKPKILNIPIIDFKIPVFHSSCYKVWTEFDLIKTQERLTKRAISRDEQVNPCKEIPLKRSFKESGWTFLTDFQNFGFKTKEEILKMNLNFDPNIPPNQR